MVLDPFWDRMLNSSSYFLLHHDFQYWMKTSVSFPKNNSLSVVCNVLSTAVCVIPFSLLRNSMSCRSYCFATSLDKETVSVIW